MAEPESLRQRERDLAVRAKRAEAARRKPAPRAKGPSTKDYLLSTLNTGLGVMPSSVSDVASRFGRDVGTYLRRSSPRDVGRTGLAVAKALPGALYESVAEDPLGFAASLIPGAELVRSVREGARLRSEGRPGEAFRVERQAIPLEALNLAPIGAAGAGVKAAARAAGRGARRAATVAAERMLPRVVERAAPTVERDLVSRAIPRERVFSVTAEETPGASSGHRPDILGGDLAVRKAYQSASPFRRATPEGDAYDVLYAAQGIPQRPIDEAAGAYLNSLGQMERNPVDVIQLDTGGDLTPDLMARIKATENVRGTLGAQEAVAGNMPIMDEGGGELLYRMPRQPSFGQMEDTASAAALDELPIGMTATSQGGLLMPFDALTASQVPSVSTLLDKLSAAYPEASVYPVRNEGFYEPALGRWGDEGIEATKPFSGEATMQTLQTLAEAPPEVSMDLSSSPEFRSAARGLVSRDVGAPTVREDLQNTRRFFADADWQNVVDLIRRGVSPAAALAAVGYSTSALARPTGE